MYQQTVTSTDKIKSRLGKIWSLLSVLKFKNRIEIKDTTWCYAQLKSWFDFAGLLRGGMWQARISLYSTGRKFQYSCMCPDTKLRIDTAENQSRLIIRALGTINTLTLLIIEWLRPKLTKIQWIYLGWKLCCRILQHLY